MSPTMSKLWPSPLSLSEFLQRLPEVKGRHVAIGLSTYIVYLILRRLVIWPLFLSPLRKVPGPPLGNLILGQSRTIVQSETGIPQREWVKKYGPVVRIVGPVGVERLIFMEPDTLHQILVKDWLQYPQPEFLRNILGLVTGYGLLTVTGDEHKQMRKAMNPAFSIPNLMSQTYMYWESIDSLVDILKNEIGSSTDGKILPVYDLMSKATLDIICETAFGYKSDSLHNPHNELAVAYEKLLALQSGPNLAKLILVMLIPGGPRFLSSDRAYHYRNLFKRIGFFRDLSTLVESMYTIRQLSKKMLEDKLRESVHVSDMDAKRDIMSILVRARKADQEENTANYTMNDQAMVDQVLTFLGAGHETTASGLTWTLWLLANDKESQRKLREELTPVIAENPHPDYRTIKDLKWLDCVVMESLRVIPPVPLTARITKETIPINGVIIPKGTMVWIPIRVANTWKVVWGEDAEEFHPERWLNLPKDYHPTFSFLSFIAGPHSCIGKTMAILEMKAILAGLIVNFEFDPAYDGQKAKPAAAITMKPVDGMPLRVRRVQRSQ
ncbi:cytochrome P450 [Macrolepiota fuliginosa MF-IS2]|uniref:Cytochrome P450 n=1 Tax=Macrolepiota fuliginosa MF-IS2 TaxID=1400762 RepID=A0A9P5XEI6_9AGAR|nr:cytochrome P450 [Macrolepiota fuliginosa MF-IS2]